jgi:FtsX-like permease family/MacB-like periplasmic core domain
MGVSMLTGRTFPLSSDSQVARVAIVSATAAARSWPGKNPVGRILRFGFVDSKPVTVIGVVADVHEQGLASDTLPQIYLPIEPGPVQSPFAVVARGSVPPETLLVDMRRAVAAVDPSQAVYDLRVMDDVLRAAAAPQEANTALIAIFAALALALAVFGTYAVVASDVALRARELGIRSALGATHSRLLRMVLREISSVVIVGGLAGLTMAWALSRVATTLIYNVSTHDPATFVIVPFALMLTMMAAIIVPAMRVRRINPANVMRAE